MNSIFKKGKSYFVSYAFIDESEITVKEDGKEVKKPTQRIAFGSNTINLMKDLDLQGMVVAVSSNIKKRGVAILNFFEIENQIIEIPDLKNIVKDAHK